MSTPTLSFPAKDMGFDWTKGNSTLMLSQCLVKEKTAGTRAMYILYT